MESGVSSWHGRDAGAWQVGQVTFTWPLIFAWFRTQHPSWVALMQVQLLPYSPGLNVGFLLWLHLSLYALPL